MKRRLFKSALLWMLPLLVVRALIPAGFMLMGGPDGLALMFCSGSMPTSHAAHGQRQEHAMHMLGSGHAAGHADRADQHSDNHAADDATTSSAPCPFALAAGAAAIDIPWLHAVSVALSHEQSLAVASIVGGYAGAYAHPIRGPPQFS